MRIYLIIALCICFQDTTAFGQVTTILYDHGSYGFDYSNLKDIKWKFERSYQIAVAQDQDRDLLKNVAIEINRQSGDQLINALAIIKSKTGQADSLTIDSFKLQPYDAVYAEYVCQLPSFNIGDTIEVRYTVKSTASSEIIRWETQHAYPVALSTFQVIIPEVALYHDHITDGTYIISEQVLDTTYVIERTRIPSKGLKLVFQDIPAYVNEPFAPDISETRPAVLFAISDLTMGNVEIYMPDWSVQVADLIVADYFGKQFRVRTNYKWLADKAASILNTNYTTELLLLKLYEFIHTQFEWDGTYGLFPSHSLQEMQDSKTINKSGFNVVLLSLLEEAGLKTYPVLVSTIDRPLVYSEIPNLNQFNHFVIAVEQGKELIYLDAGDPLLPIGFVDTAVRRSRAMMIKNYKGVWTEIPDFSAKSTTLVSLHVHKDLSASGTIDVSFEGYDAQNERHYLKADPQAQYWKQRVMAISPDIKVDSVRFENVKNLLKPFINRVYFHITPSADQEEMAFYPVFYSFFNQPYFSDSSRVNRVVFPSQIMEQAIFNIILDPVLKVRSIPKELKLRMIDSSIETEFRQSKQIERVQCTVSIALHKKVIEPVYYDALRTFLMQLSAKLNEPIVIGRS